MEVRKKGHGRRAREGRKEGKKGRKEKLRNDALFEIGWEGEWKEKRGRERRKEKQAAYENEDETHTCFC
jgi:hypothetical protein